MENCTRCGEKLPQSAHFCPVCGLEVTPEEQEITAAPQVEETSSRSRVHESAAASEVEGSQLEAETTEQQLSEETADYYADEIDPLEQPHFNPKYIRNIAMFCHIAAFAGLSAPLIGNILAPFVLWRLKRRDDPFIDYNGKQALNFQISMSIFALIVFVTSALLAILSWLFFLVIGLWVFGIVRASIKANSGIEYRYPLSYSFFK